MCGGLNGEHKRLCIGCWRRVRRTVVGDGGSGGGLVIQAVRRAGDGQAAQVAGDRVGTSTGPGCGLSI